MNDSTWGGDAVPLPPLFQSGALRDLMHDRVLRRALESKLEALGLTLEDIVYEP